MYIPSLYIAHTPGDFFFKRKGKCCYFKYTVSRTTFSQKVISIFSLEKAKSEVAQTNQHLNSPLCCLKWCLLILHTVPSATLSHAGYALTLLKLCFTASGLRASIVKSCCTHTVCHKFRQYFSYTGFSSIIQKYRRTHRVRWKKENMIKGLIALHLCNKYRPASNHSKHTETRPRYNQGFCQSASWCQENKVRCIIWPA